jgi:hypothetical protein
VEVSGGKHEISFELSPSAIATHVALCATFDFRISIISGPPLCGKVLKSPITTSNKFEFSFIHVADLDDPLVPLENEPLQQPLFYHLLFFHPQLDDSKW